MQPLLHPPLVKFLSRDLVLVRHQMDGKQPTVLVEEGMADGAEAWVQHLLQLDGEVVTGEESLTHHQQGVVGVVAEG